MSHYKIKNCLAVFGTLSVLLPSLSFADTVLATEFRSPHGLTEKCYQNSEIPGDQRSPEARQADRKQESKLCGIDFYSPQVALCPKTWSTSAGTIVHTLADRPEDSKTYEQRICPLGKDDPSQSKTLAKFKTTMNASGTSGTFSSSSAVYYQLSRFLGTSVTVPVAVMRTLDPRAHYDRVSNAPKRPQSAMNGAAWEILKKAELTPNSYSPVHELYTADLSQIFGVLLKDKGERYGVEVNGIRSAWGVPQNMDFQNTMPFRALRNSKDLLSSIKEAPSQVDARVRAATGTPADLQMVFWMNEISEIALMDYVMSQQDRIGNIDYVWTWYSVGADGQLEATVDDSKLARTRMSTIEKPQELNGKEAVLLQRSWIGDNDAGGRLQYVNYTKTTKMLEGIRHINPKFYRRVLALAADLKVQGPLFQHLKNNFFLSADQMKMIATNANLAAGILEQTCKQRQLHFDLMIDLKPNSLSLTGKELPMETVGCSL